MNWNSLTQIEQLKQLDELSVTKPVLIYKHSTRCGISSTALARIERAWKTADADFIEPYYLDLIAHRNVSNAVAEHYHVSHESPQALVIKNGKCVYSETHLGINMPEILSHLVG